MSQPDCVFCRIGSGEIPVEVLYEDPEFVAFPDRNPQAPVHALIIPRAHYETLMDVPDAGVLGRALDAAREVARRTRVDADGFRVVMNCGDDGGQTVYHLHLHVLGGRFLSWPPG